jgi:16S rRNA (guanine966-N2)-methyltransferase
LLRPTPDALREQAFTIIGQRLAGATFLDLFAGTGVNALEALSRGASRVVLVEQAPKAAEVIRRNFALRRARGQWSYCSRRWVRCRLSRAGSPVPGLRDPLASWAEAPWPVLARESGVLEPGAEVVLEAPPKVDVSVSGFSLVRELRGAVLLRAG